MIDSELIRTNLMYRCTLINNRQSKIQDTFCMLNKVYLTPIEGYGDWAIGMGQSTYTRLRDLGLPRKMNKS